MVFECLDGADTLMILRLQVSRSCQGSIHSSRKAGKPAAASRGVFPAAEISAMKFLPCRSDR